MALVFSKDRQRIIADHLGLRPQELVFNALYSEEAQVYKISKQDRTIVAWLKVHNQPAKARRETQVLREWGSLLNGPKVITVIEERILLLSHCRGESVHSLNRSQAEYLGAALGKLHTHPIADHDALPLAEALRRREHTLLRSIDLISQRLRTEDADYAIYSKLIEFLAAD